MSGNSVTGSIYAALEKNIPPQFGKGLIPIQTGGQGGFCYYYQNVSGQSNQWAYEIISTIVKADRQSGPAQLSTAGSFSVGYLRLLGLIAFQLGSADNQILADSQNNTVAQASNVVQAWILAFGPITATQANQAAALLGYLPQALDYVISYQVAAVWSGSTPRLTYLQMSQAPSLRNLLPRMPPNAGPLLAAVEAYIAAAQPALAVMDLQGNGNWMLNQMRTNLSSKNLANGTAGMETFDPTGVTANQWTAGYTFGKSIQQIVQDLSGQVTLTLSIRIGTGSSGNTISIDGGPAVPYSGSLLGAAAASTESQMLAGRASSSLTLTYQGFSLIPVTPWIWSASGAISGAKSLGWYNPAVLAEAARNSRIADPPSGFIFVSPPPFDLEPFPSGQFNLLSSILISNYPTLSASDLVVTGNVAGVRAIDAIRMAAPLKIAKPAFHLFGEIPLGRIVTGQRELGGSLLMAATPGVPTYQQTACVLAGAVQSPAVS